MWQPTTTDRFTEYLQFFIRSIALTIGIAAGIATVYVSIKVCWFSVDYLDHTLFGQTWW